MKVTNKTLKKVQFHFCHPVTDEPGKNERKMSWLI